MHRIAKSAVFLCHSLALVLGKKFFLTTADVDIICLQTIKKKREKTIKIAILLGHKGIQKKLYK